MAVNMRKVAIVGCGRSGSAVSFSLMQSGLFSEMVLVDSLAKKAERVAHDLAYGISFVKPMNIYAGGYDDLADAGIIVIAAGEPRLSTDSRMEFIRKNVNVLYMSGTVKSLLVPRGRSSCLNNGFLLNFFDKEYNSGK